MKPPKVLYWCFNNDNARRTREFVTCPYKNKTSGMCVLKESACHGEKYTLAESEKKGKKK